MKIGFSLFFIFAVFQATAQYHTPENYSINNGLPSSEVYHIIQAKDGYMWFATDRGICRYNGYEFESFNVNDGLVDNTVFKFYSAPNGTIWCTTLGCKLFYFKSDHDFTPYPYNHIIQNAVKNAAPACLFFYNKALYLSFSNLNGYIKVDEQGVLTNRITPFKNEKKLIFEKTGNHTGFAYSIDKNETFQPLFEHSGSLVYSTKNGNAVNVLFMDNHTVIADFNDAHLYTNGIPQELAIDKYPIGIGKIDEEHFWIGYRFGGFKIYTSNGEEVFTGLKDKSVTSLCVDHENGLWASTLNSGVYYYKQSPVHLMETTVDISNTVTDITVDDNHTVFVAYNDGNVLKKQGDTLSLVYKPDKKSAAKVQFYRSTDQTVINSNLEQFTTSNPDSIFYKSRGVLNYDDNPDHYPAIGAHSSFCIGLNKSNEIHVNFRVNDLTPYKNGYCLGSNQGLFYYHLQEKSITKLVPYCNYRFEDIDQVRDIYYGATLGYGLFILDSDSLYNIDKNDGLYSNMISAVTVENDSVIWVCTNRGINRIQLNFNGSKYINGFSLVDGLPGNETVDLEITGDTIWVGTKMGLCHFSKKELEEVKDKTSNFYLTIQKIKVNDFNTNFEKLTSLSFNENNIEFFFQSISFKNNSRLKYDYIMEGLDASWHSTNQLSVRYPAIPPGSYTFILKVYNTAFPDQVNQLNIPIVISPPFYSTWWFFILISTSVAGLIYLFFKLYIFTYNRDVVRELLRQLLKRIKLKDTYIVFRVSGKDVRVDSSEIIYVKAAGNYLDVFTTSEKHTVRCKISEFLSLVPDPIEFVRVHRSYIVRIDRIKKKDSKAIYVDGIEIPITKAFKEAAQNIQF